MRKWLMLALLFVMMISPSRAGAQSGVKLDAMSVELWSEYDQPSMLVINEFVVSQDTSLPAKVTLHFPKAGNLVAVAVRTDDGLFNKDFAPPTEQGDWQAVTINVQSHDPHRIEYYQQLTRVGNQRKFTYQWYGDYAVKQFLITLQVPADSTALITSPLLESTTKTTDGLDILGRVTKNDIKPGNPFSFDLQYERTSDALTGPIEADKVQSSEPVGTDTLGRVSITNLPWVIGGFGLALIGIALFAYWRSTQSSESKPRRQRHHQPKEPDTVEAYCHECGTRAHPGDRFCRTCGSKLRANE